MEGPLCFVSSVSPPSSFGAARLLVRVRIKRLLRRHGIELEPREGVHGEMTDPLLLDSWALGTIQGPAVTTRRTSLVGQPLETVFPPGYALRMRYVARTILLLMITVVLAEALLQLASLFAFGRTIGESDGREVILCVGDSHTYGVIVEESESYPAQLENFLEEQAAGRFRVVNLGVPGRSTTEVLHNLPEQIARYSPSWVIVWAGVNDGWNKLGTADRRSSSIAETIESYAMNLKLYKLALVWRHARAIDSTLRRPIVDQGKGRLRVVGLGYSEDHRIDRYPEDRMHGDERIAARLRENYQQIESIAVAARVTPLFITYPFERRAFVQPNEALREAMVPLFVSNPSIRDLPLSQKKLLWAGHPNKFMYRSIARDLAKRLLEPLSVAPSVVSE